ncbi:MAG: ABC transporter ATP-binding protein [Planctomycetota bacterium]|nr:MAG: ABC transporter ATP-binding protein [Planctomycetota bacterium]
MSEELLIIQGLEKNFDGIRALADFSCSLSQGQILGLIGPNGAGKTTLLNIISGFTTPERGNITFKGMSIVRMSPHKIARAGIARTFQDLRLIRQLSVLENVLLSFENQPGEHLANLFFRWKQSKKQEAAIRNEALILLAEAGLAEKANDQAENLSYGQQKLLSLVCCLAAKGDLVLLDEPVAGIAPEMIDNILGIIRDLPQKKKSVILIEHNLDVVMQICDRIIFMDAGTKICEGTPGEVRNDAKVIEAYTG